MEPSPNIPEPETLTLTTHHHASIREREEDVKEDEDLPRRRPSTTAQCLPKLDEQESERKRQRLSSDGQIREGAVGGWTERVRFPRFFSFFFNLCFRFPSIHLDYGCFSLLSFFLRENGWFL
jgi:hypothetical protein